MDELDVSDVGMDEDKDKDDEDADQDGNFTALAPPSSQTKECQSEEDDVSGQDGAKLQPHQHSRRQQRGQQRGRHWMLGMLQEEKRKLWKVQDKMGMDVKNQEKTYRASKEVLKNHKKWINFEMKLK